MLELEFEVGMHKIVPKLKKLSTSEVKKKKKKREISHSFHLKTIVYDPENTPHSPVKVNNGKTLGLAWLGEK